MSLIRMLPNSGSKVLADLVAVALPGGVLELVGRPVNTTAVV
jgi:hypothetical protein